jgi:integrase
MSIRRVTNPKTGHRGYEVRWREGERHRSRTFMLKGDAVAWDREVARRRQLGPLAVTQLTSRGMTLSDWITQRWTVEHGSQLEPATRSRYSSSYQLHIEPWLGHVVLNELTVGRLREWQVERLADGVSAHAIDKARTFLSSVLRHAVESEAIVGNPLASVRAPRAAHADEVVPLAPETVERIRSHMTAESALIVAVLAYSGIRPGELRGLRWQDVRERTLLIQKGTNPDGSTKSTKTRRARTVDILAPLAADLQEWRGSRHGRLVLPQHDHDECWTKDDWDNWREDHWRPACRRAGLVDLPRPYDLRHSFASLLLAEGRSVHFVAGQLGHSPKETLNTYGHVISELGDEKITVEDEIAKARQAVIDTWDRGRLLTTAQAAERLGIHEATVIKAARDGRIPGATKKSEALKSPWLFDAMRLELLPMSPKEGEPS